MKNESLPIGHKTPSSSEFSLPEPIRPIREWQQKFERYLLLIGRKASHERYSRALERFLGKHPEKKFAHQFLRPAINQYVVDRLAEGASIATVRVELSAILAFFQFMLDMQAADVLLNPARGVKVPRKSPQRYFDKPD